MSGSGHDSDETGRHSQRETQAARYEAGYDTKMSFPLHRPLEALKVPRLHVEQAEAPAARNRITPSVGPPRCQSLLREHNQREI